MEYVQHSLMRLLWVVVVVMLAVENGCNGCLEKERIALLQLKDSINFPYGTSLPSWEEDDNMDCCYWERVECNSTTHRVIKLELDRARDRRTDGYWHLNASILLPFESLRSLILSQNRLRSFVGNEGIGISPNFSNLEELDLSNNYLDNSMLTSLNKLPNLKLLRLAWNDLNGSIYVEEFDGLNNLKELDLRGNAIASISALNGSQEESGILKKLEVLHLNSNDLNDSVWSFLGGLSSIKTSDLSFNEGLHGAIHSIEILSTLTNLEKLDLSEINLGNDILPSLNRLSNLKFLRLAWNKLNGSIYVKEFDGLNNLKELDLSGNAIASISAPNGSQEESGILKKLEVLHLNSNDLNDSVWSFLGGLSSIKTLDLSFNEGLHGAIHRLCELKKLQELDVTQSSFGDTLPWCLSNLTSLRLLDITSNHFTGNVARSPLINLTSLEYLAISNNHFEVPISFKSFFNHSKLVFIESLNNTLLEEEDFLATSPSFQLIGLCLSNFEHGHITRSFPRFLYHQHDLVLVELSDFSNKFPNWLLDNNTRMETLFLSHNSFGGQLLFPSHPTRNLIMLDIANNHLEGILPYKIANFFPSLEFLNMSTNNFEGDIPSSFGDMTALKMLDLSNNKLSAEIPIHLTNGCRLLQCLRPSHNFFIGPVLPQQSNLTQLEFLYCDNNGFTEIPPILRWSTLSILDVSANQLVGKIPGFIGNHTSLNFLAMAGNHLEGPIPIEFCQLKNLMLLDLSENNITGVVPSCFNSSGITSVRLSKNRLDGRFPMAFRYDGLKELDLSYNQFSGTIPTWIGNLSYLEVLLLQHNHFEGNIPKELCKLSSLTLIDLSSNNLFGCIPPCIGNINFKGGTLSSGYGVSYHFITYSRHIFTLWLHDLKMVLDKSRESKDEILERSITGEVRFTTKGMSLSYKGIVLSLFSGIDLSHNRLTGPIPPQIGNLSHLRALNLSHNNFTGTIPVTFLNLKSIESLDLSYNHLNGKIPSQLTVLNFLVVFNLSYNNLSGRMPPRVNQFGTFEPNSYVGNPLLCGEPLPMKCNATDSPPLTPKAVVNDTEEDSGFMDMYVFYMSFAGSYVTVVLAIMVILLINPYWRRAWFHLVEVYITSCYYFVVDNLVEGRRGFLWK